MRDTKIAGGDRHAGFEPPHQFLQHEYRARGGRVESGGEARARSGRNQRPGVRPFQAGQFSRHMGDDRTHLHARAFTAKRQPRSDREQAADELDRQHDDRSWWHVLTQHRFDVGNSAARRFRRVAADQAGRERNRGRAAAGYEQEAHHRCRVCPADQRVTPRVRVLEENAEQGSDRAGSGAHDTRQQHEQDQAAVAVFEIGGFLLIGIHRLWNPTSNPPAAARRQGGARTGPPDRMLGEYHGQPNSLRWTSSSGRCGVSSSGTSSESVRRMLPGILAGLAAPADRAPQ